jgi:signal transduction histidine kinase
MPRARGHSQPEGSRAFDGLTEGEAASDSVLLNSLAVPYTVAGRTEKLVYVRDPGDLAAYEELRAGFTASVSHELRTPLGAAPRTARERDAPDADRDELIEQAQAEVRQIGELIDDVLFLSELESGRELVALGSTAALPILEEVVASLTEPRRGRASPCEPRATPKRSSRCGLG